MRILLAITILAIITTSCGLNGVMGNNFTRCVSTCLMYPNKIGSICRIYNVKLALDKKLLDNDYRILKEIHNNRGRTNWGYVSNTNDTKYGVNISSRDYQYYADFDFKYENNEWVLNMIRLSDSSEISIYE